MLRAQLSQDGNHLNFHQWSDATNSNSLVRISKRYTMKIKTSKEIWKLIDNRSLNEYLSKREETSVQKKQGVLSLETHDTLLARHKLLRIQLEEITKKLEAYEVAKLSSNRVVHDFCEQAHESGVCVLASLGLS